MRLSDRSTSINDWLNGKIWAKSIAPALANPFIFKFNRSNDGWFWRRDRCDWLGNSFLLLNFCKSVEYRHYECDSNWDRAVSIDVHLLIRRHLFAWQCESKTSCFLLRAEPRDLQVNGPKSLPLRSNSSNISPPWSIVGRNDRSSGSLLVYLNNLLQYRSIRID